MTDIKLASFINVNTRRWRHVYEIVLQHFRLEANESVNSTNITGKCRCCHESFLVWRRPSWQQHNERWYNQTLYTL